MDIGGIEQKDETIGVKLKKRPHEERLKKLREEYKKLMIRAQVLQTTIEFLESNPTASEFL